jgi:hypothetical protein
MAGEKNVSTRLETVDTNQDLADYKTSEAHIEEVVIARLTEEDLCNLSAESLRFKSWTTFRLALIMFVQGCNQAGYGVDWVRTSLSYLLRLTILIRMILRP